MTFTLFTKIIYTKELYFNVLRFNPKKVKYCAEVLKWKEIWKRRRDAKKPEKKLYNNFLVYYGAVD